MAKKKRVKIPKKVEGNILFLNDHTCCICNDPTKPVQIHHINEDPSDNRLENLAVVCVECQSKIHRKGYLEKGYSADEVKRYKDWWQETVSKKRENLLIPHWEREKEGGLIPTKGTLRSISIIPSIEPLESEINKVVEEAKLSRDFQGFEDIETKVYGKSVPLGNGRTVKYMNEQTTKTIVEVVKDIEEFEIEPELEKMSKKIQIPKDLTSDEISGIKIISYFEGVYDGLLKCLLEITHPKTKIYEMLLKRGIIFTENKEIQIPENITIKKVFVYENIKNAFPISYDEQNNQFPEIVIKAIKLCDDIKVYIFLAIEKKYNEFSEKQKHIIRNKIMDNKDDYLMLWIGSRVLEDKKLLSFSDHVSKLSEKNKFTHRIYYNFYHAYLNLILKDGVISSKIKIDKNVLNKAKLFINKALAEEPQNPKYLACLATTNVLERDYTKGIRNATKALRIDEKNINALNALGISYFNKGEYNNALINFKIISDILPKNTHNLLNIGEMYRAQNMFKEAVEPLTEALENDSSNDAINAALGIVYFNLKKYSDANNYLDNALDKNSNCELALFGKADIYKNIDFNWLKAIEFYKRGLKSNPFNFMGWVALAEVYLKHGQLREAKRIYTKLSKENPENKDVQIGLGGYYANVGDIENTKLWCNKIIQNNPKNTRALFCIGVAYNNSKKFKESIEYFDKAIEINPIDDEVLFAKGSALFSINELKNAKKLLIDATEINPMNSNAFLTLAKVENNLANYQNALGYSNQIREIMLSSEKLKLKTEMEFISGIININLKRYQDALKCFKALLKLEPDNINALKNIGKVYGIIGKFKKAKRILLKSQKISSDDIEIKKDLGFVYYNLKQYDKSISLLEGIYESDINDFNVNYVLAISYSNIGDFNFAIKKYQKAFEINPNDKSNLINMGLCLANLKNYKDSKEKFEIVVNLYSKNIDAWLFLAEVQLKLELINDCIKSIKKVLKIYPKDNLIYHRIGLIFKNNSDFQNAIKYFEKSNQIKESKESWLELGMCYNSLNKHKKGIECYKNILKKFHEDAIVYANLGVSYAFLNFKNKAIKYFKKSLDLDKKYFLSWTNLSVIYFNDKDYNAAIECMIKAHEIKPLDTDILIHIGDIFNNNLHDFENAIKYFKKAIKLAPKNVKYIFALANCYNNIQNYSEAIKWHKKALRINPKNVNIMAWMAMCYVFTRKNKVAKKWLNRSIELDPNNYNAILGLSVYYNNTGKMKEAIEWGEKGLKCDPSNINTYIILTIIGNSYNQLKQYSKSIESFEKARKLNPTDINILRLGGYPYSNINKYEKTIEYWKEYLKNMPDDWEFFGYLGATYMKTNNFYKAIECFKKVIELRPEVIRSYYSLGDAYLKSQNIFKAIEVYNKLKHIDERNEPWLHIGDIYFNILKDFKKAIKEYSEAMKINPTNWKAWKNLGISYDEIGNNKKALECYEKGLGIEKDNIELLSLKGELLIKLIKK